MSSDHDHHGEYADDRHDHDLDYAEKHHRHYDDEREVSRLTGALREASAQTELLRREHAGEIRQLWERVRQLEAALQPQPDPPVPCEEDTLENGRDDEPWDDSAWSLLPTGQAMNPARPEGATYYDKDQVAYIVTGGGPENAGVVRVLTSFGRLRGWNLRTVHAIRHDQSRRSLGRWSVTGIRNYKTGTQSGDIPDRPVRQWVFK